jgi:hypothetical protein
MGNFNCETCFDTGIIADSWPPVKCPDCKLRASERDYVLFTRSSIIVYGKAAKRLGVKDGEIFMGSCMHDVNGTGVLYGMNYTDRRGISEL